MRVNALSTCAAFEDDFALECEVTSDDEVVLVGEVVFEVDDSTAFLGAAGAIRVKALSTSAAFEDEATALSVVDVGGDV